MKLRFILIVLSVLALLNTAGFAQTVESNIAVVKRFYEEFSAGNPEVILEVHPEMLTMHYADSVDQVATQVLYEDLKALKEVNPDLTATVHDIFGAGDLVVANITWTTTHTGDYFGIAATGKTSVHNGLVVRKLDNGKIVESWEMFDDLAFLTSIGYLGSWDEITAHPPVVCNSNFEATVHTGPSAGLSLQGKLAIVVKEDGALDGQLTLADGSKVATIGQATGRAINLMLTSSDNQQFFGVGSSEYAISDCTGVLGGPFVGPMPGDSGDWVIKPVEGGTEEPPADDSGDSSSNTQEKGKGKPGRGLLE
jgi:predicted ester cyclase